MLTCMVSVKETKKKNEASGVKPDGGYSPKTVSVSSRFLHIFWQTVANLERCLVSIGSKWLSCILTSTCFGMMSELQR